MSDKSDYHALIARTTYNEAGKALFHRVGRKLLRRLAKEMGLAKGSFSIRSNMGGIAVSGEIRLCTDTFHGWIMQSGYGAIFVYRGRKNANDWCGYRNHTIDALDLVEQLKKVAQDCNAVIARGSNEPAY